MSFVTCDWTIQDVLPRTFNVADFLVSDVPEERRFVEQRQDKLSIVNVESPQN